MKTIILINGPKRSGKNYLAEIMQDLVKDSAQFSIDSTATYKFCVIIYIIVSLFYIEIRFFYTCIYYFNTKTVFCQVFSVVLKSKKNPIRKSFKEKTRIGSFRYLFETLYTVRAANCGHMKCFILVGATL